MQSLRKGAEVYIADFKGGVDFPKVAYTEIQVVLDLPRKYCGVGPLGGEDQVQPKGGIPKEATGGNRVPQPGRIQRGHRGEPAPADLRL